MKKLALCFSLLVAPATQADNLKSYLWSNQTGFLEASECQPSTSEESGFFVVRSKGKGRKSYENMRTHAGGVKHYLLNDALVKAAKGTRKRSYEYVQVVGLSPQPSVIVNRWFAKRLDEGYVFQSSLKEIKNFVFELRSVDRSKTGELPVSPNGLFLQSKMNGKSYSTLKCGAKEYVLFDAFRTGSEDPTALIGINIDETAVLARITTRTPEQAEDVAAERLQAQQEAQTNSAAPVTGAPAVSTETPTRSLPETAPTPTPSPLNVDREYTVRASTPLEDDRAGADEEETTVDAEETDEEADIEDETAETEGEEPVEEFDGNYETVVCLENKSASVAVRSDDLQKVLFNLKNGVPVKVSQDWEGNTTVQREIHGVTYDFVRVQVTADNRIGWIASTFVKQKSHCASLESDLPDEENTGAQSTGETLPPGDYFVCTQAGSPLSAYDTTFTRLSSQDFLAAGSKVSVKDGALFDLPQPNGYSYVQVTTAEGALRFVAKDFLSKNACQSTSGGSEVGGYIFPTFHRTGWSYVNSNQRPNQDPKLTRFAGYRSNWGVYGARRSGGRRAHAANDLYQPFGLPRPNKAFTARHFGGAFRAMHGGRVVRGSTHFYLGTYYIVVLHDDGVVTRYGEIYPGTTYKSSRVKTGEKLGYIKWVGQGSVPPMLHLEHYHANNNSVKRGNLGGQKRINGRNSQRSNSLFDRTSFMRKLEERSL